MKAVTSIGFTRIARQQYCIATWQSKGLEVVAVQAPGETERLKPYFPGVRFKEKELPSTNIFSKDTPTIYSLVKQANEENESILLINSDISIKDRCSQFAKDWANEPKTFHIGIRQDSMPGSRRRHKQKWGIDAFKISPEMAQNIPDLGFRIGCPGWDFWIVYYFHLLGYSVKVTQSQLFHELHPIGWVKADQVAYRNMISEKYKVAHDMLPSFILDITNRRDVTQFSYPK